MADLTGKIEKIVRGDDYQVIRTIDSIPNSQVLVEAWFTVREEFWSSQEVLQKNITTVSNADGQITDDGAGDNTGTVVFELLQADTTDLYEWYEYTYDIQVLTDTGKIFTPEFGTFITHPSVTLDV